MMGMLHEFDLQQIIALLIAHGVQINQKVPCLPSKLKSPDKAINTTRIYIENHADSAPPRPESWDEAREIVNQN